MHQLQRGSLHNEMDLDSFFERYLGASVLQMLEQPPVRFPTWPEATRQALRALCIHYAQAMPEADHVVRADVNTCGHAPRVVEGDLLLYFGHQFSGKFQRRQYTGVTYAPRQDGVVLVMYVAGSPNEQNRQKLIAEEDRERRLERRVIRSVADVVRMAHETEPVLQAQRQALIAMKGKGTSGFCPVFCQRRWNVEERRREDEAADELLGYWQRRQNDLPPDQVQREHLLMCENNKYRCRRAIAYVRDHVPVEDAHALALSEHA